MSFLKRALQRGISEGLGNVVEKATQNIANDIAESAQQTVENAAQDLKAQQEQQTYTQTEPQQSQTNTFAGLEGMFANFKTAVEDLATEATKNMKICPECGQPSGADKKFCPGCGAKLPEETVAQGAVCPDCGKQNAIGTKFCQDCGTKLPQAVQEEERKLAKDADIMAQWDTLLDVYPKWNCGGTDFNIEDFGDNIMFAATFDNITEAQNAVKNYRILLQENGFVMAGQYPNVEHLYKKLGGKCFHVDTEHCFDSGYDNTSIYFNTSEPYGGFDYKKSEEKPQINLKGLFGF